MSIILTKPQTDVKRIAEFHHVFIEDGSQYETVRCPFAFADYFRKETLLMPEVDKLVCVTPDVDTNCTCEMIFTLKE